MPVRRNHTLGSESSAAEGSIFNSLSATPHGDEFLPGLTALFLHNPIPFSR